MRTYQVKKGDTLYKIARDTLKSEKAWYQIADANEISAPYVLTPGQILNIPSSEDEDLIELFYKHLPLIEGNYPYMYLDSKGFLTIGFGTLISKLDGPRVKSLVRELQKLSSEQLRTDLFETLDQTQVNDLYKEASINLALKKVKSFEFEIGHGKKVNRGKSYVIDIYRRSHLFTHIRQEAIEGAFNELLRKSVLLKAQQAKLGDKYEANSAKSFFTYEGKPGANNLVIKDEKIESMAKEMIKEKIKQLRSYLPTKEGVPGFDGYPFSIRLALLDMAYNMGANKLLNTPASKGGFEQFTKLVKSQQWQKIVETKHYFRRDVSQERNDFVKKCFKEASK